MRLKLPFFTKAHPAPVERKSAVLGLNDALSEFLKFSGSTAATPASALNLYDKSTAVSIPVNKVGDAFASLVPVLEIDGKIVTEHEVLDLLRTPNPFMTGNLFLETLGKHYLITGEAGVVATGTVTRPPLELWAITPADVSTNEGAGGVPATFDISGSTMSGNYILNTNRGVARYFDGTLREFKQIRGFSTQGSSLLRGQSLLRSASQEVRQHILGNTHNVSLLEKGGRVSLVFHFDQDMDEDDFEEVKARVRSQYGGAQNAGEVGVTAGGKLDIKEAGINNKDMDFANLQKMATHAVALQYKVPLPLISNDAATFNNYREAKLALYDDAVLPLADRIFAGLTNLLIPRYGLDPAKVRITYNVDSITALATRRNEELKLRKDVAIESVNELRETIGREAVDGGDQVLAPANLIPIGTVVEPNAGPNASVVREDEA